MLMLGCLVPVDRLREDVRCKYGVPPAGNANFAWIQHIVHHLAPERQASFGSMSSVGEVAGIA